jgi:anti-anti-sigma factor
VRSLQNLRIETSVPTDTAFQPFRVDVHEEEGRIRVAPVGELDLATAPVVEEALAAAFASPARNVTLDLRGVTFMDSSGLRVVLQFDAAARSDGTAFGLIRGEEVVQRVFDATRVAERLTFVEP